jgi:alpha,alpha-trehalose phosphorylase
MKAYYREPGDTSLPEYMDRLRFPAEPWRLVETKFSDADLGTTESLFSVGNGYLGLRGNIEEGHDAFSHGTFINGFHETWPIKHAEEAFGFARTGQTIANVPDPKIMRLYVDDEPLLLSVADLAHYERALDMANGVLSRDLVWRTPSGNRVQVTTRRMVSFTHRHIAIMTFEVTLLDAAAPVAVSSQLLNRAAGVDEYRSNLDADDDFDPRKANLFMDRVLVPRLHQGDETRVALGYECANSGMTLAVAMEHWIDCENEVTQDTHVEEDYAKHVFQTRLEPGQKLHITKVVSYHTSRSVPPRELAERCHRTLDRVKAEGVDQQFQEQREWLDEFWKCSDINVGGNDAVQQAVRFNLFHLAQAGARADGRGIPAKGVTGSGYGGHYFWDTEIYVLPFFTYTLPGAARNALRFRYRLLPAAERRAAELAQYGALFPWRTINGEEASAYYAAGTAQYHIDADVAYAIDKYVRASGDEDFLAREGIDVLVQTARMWADLGFWRQVEGEDPSFRIHGVTGPDEYTTVVNDNLYTNVMARFNLRCAAKWVREMADRWPDEHRAMVRRLALTDDEVDEWERAAEGMAILWEERLGIHPQDAQFNQREMWDLGNTPPEKRPLLLHFHPLVIYRFQVLKQADVVLALVLQGDEFTAEQKKADFDYYDPITTGDSTLSGAAQGIIAAEVGYDALALSYFWDSVLVDLADLHGNTSDGIHVASTGGVWAALVYGFGGMRDHGDVLKFDPRLPAEWESLTFRIKQRETRVRVDLTQTAISFTVEEGPGLAVQVRGAKLSVTHVAPVVVSLEHQGPRLPGGPHAENIHGSVREDGSVITLSLPANVVAAESDDAAMEVAEGY